MSRKTVVIHQPDFIPYLGFFQRLLSADLFILLDHVQFAPRNWTHRDKIKTLHGEQWLTLSIEKTPRDTPIDHVALSTTTNWPHAHLNLLHENYRQAPYYRDLLPTIEALYETRPPLLAEFNLRWIGVIAKLLDINVPIVSARSLNPVGQKNLLLIDLLKKTEATHYLTGTGSRDYLDTQAFDAAGIEVIWQAFKHPVYPQQFGEFIPFLSTLDALMNCGSAGTRTLLLEASR